ncbi:pyridoxamine 5'-phosphate oxidase family protein [Qipengyuania sp. 1NDH17]|uniref:Pyridoxamine 5'-phosphate oxidase family protein n=1 Tax=Qipengyuania polymorpha TaxID=2867234 RepID=A0ABS7IU14_9SPHN|nr:pyridoxamine 5'-phosphate oxidase family protein [Qipengyuania polymorpha]MBX7456857.1 pyridoxamine 5'-phosphate oxidase family protein [Qipengyuania polymorpha]
MERTLEAVKADIIRLLHKAASDRNSPMHTPVIATADADARIMVLRAFDERDWTLRFHTDARSPKSGVIGEEGQVGVLFYDRDEKVQIRCRGTGRIESASQRAQAAWESSDAYARRCYLGAAPGEESDRPSSGLPEWAEGERPTEEQLAPARANFAVLMVTLASVDWYHLSNDGHRRAVFENGKGRWLTP